MLRLTILGMLLGFSQTIILQLERRPQSISQIEAFKQNLLHLGEEGFLAAPTGAGVPVANYDNSEYFA